MNDKNDSPRALKWRIVAFVTIAFFIAAVAVYHSYTKGPRDFVRQWSARFRAVETLDAAKRFGQSEPVYVRVLPSGEWFIATCEHACCSGAGFDATVIRDSKGTIYVNTTHTFCGVEGLSDELGEHRVPARSLAAFYSALSWLKLQKQ